MGNSDIIDTRDLVKRLAELDALEEPGTPEAEGLDEADLLDDDLREERDSIRELFDEISGYAGDRPEDGILLIADSYFTDYAREFAEDVGYLTREVVGRRGYGTEREDLTDSWPFNHIDWDAAADDLRLDFTSVEFDGTTWWYR